MLRFSRLDLMGVVATVLMAAGAQGQTFTTAAEVKPILTATKPSWVAVRAYEGQDLLYFTNLMAWRCGVASVSYSLNGGAAQDLPMEPCHEDSAQPNALLMDSVLPFVTLPLQSLETLSVTVTFDDGTTEQGDYLRPAILMP
jgi:hypothetical protein